VGGFDLRPERRGKKIGIWKGFGEKEESSNNRKMNSWMRRKIAKSGVEQGKQSTQKNRRPEERNKESAHLRFLTAVPFCRRERKGRERTRKAHRRERRPE
jgi:hypothetical protein